MKENRAQRELMARYLLGELTEEESEQIEEAYITDPSFLQELLAMRYDLIDGFVQGSLNTSDHARFEHRLRSSPALQEKVEFAKTFFQTVESIHPIQRSVMIPEAKRRRMTQVLPGLRLPSWPGISISPLGGLAAAGLVIIVAVIWFAARSRENTARPGEEVNVANNLPRPTQSPNLGVGAAPEQRKNPPEALSSPNKRIIPGQHESGNMEQPNPPVKAAPFTTSLFLTYTGIRGNSEPPALVLPANTGTLRLRLEIEEDAAQRENRAPHYQAVLQV